MQNKKGQIAIVSQLLPVLVIPLLLIVMVVVFGNFESAVDTSTLSTAAKDAINKTVVQSYTAFNMASILPLIVIAVAIITVIIGAFLFTRR